MRKRSFKIKKYINPEIMVGDKVRLTDGSALTCNKLEKDVYIANSYPELGIRGRLKDYDATVKEVGVTDRFCPGAFGSGYLQDIVISINGVDFRTTSSCVTKVEESHHGIWVNVMVSRKFHGI